jgi:hypothetical protein
VGEERERKIEFLLGAISCFPLYLLWRTPPQKDAAPIRARRFGFMRRLKNYYTPVRNDWLFLQIKTFIFTKNEVKD